MKIDTHTHIWDNLNFSKENKRYVPKYIFTQNDLEKTVEKYDIENIVLVQPSFLGNDNSLLLDTLKNYPDKYRGVIVMDDFNTYSNLNVILNKYDILGVKGIRFNLIGKLLPNFNEEKFNELFSILTSLDWHVEIHANEDDICKLFKDFQNYNLKIVLDHFGRPKDTKYSDEFISILNSEILFYIKLSGSYRFNNYCINNYVDTLLEILGEKRLLWGSDCPFTGFEDIINYEKSIEFVTKNELLYNLQNTLDKNAKELFSWR